MDNINTEGSAESEDEALDRAAAEAAANPTPSRSASPVLDKIVLSKGDPMASARKFKEICRKHNAIFVHWREMFYRWNGRMYREINDKEMNKQAWNFLDAAHVMTIDKDGIVGYEKYKPMNANVMNFVNALSATISISDNVDAPDWIIAPPGGWQTRDIIAVRNGLYHIPTQQLIPHDANFFCLGVSDIDVDVRAPAPTKWLKFLSEALPEDQQSIDTLQEIFGYLLSTDTSQQKIFALNGVPRAGKGTILRVLRLLAGESNCASTSIKALCAQFGIAGLVGKKIGILPDASVGSKTDSVAGAETMKAISGEDNVPVDRKFKSTLHITLPTRLVIASNELLSMIDNSGALASRLILIEFRVSMLGKEDTALFDKLKAESAGIFNWAMEGRKRLTERGHFVQPDSSKESLDEVAGLGSPVISFVRDRCDLRAGAETRTSILYSAYKDWCSNNGLHPTSAAWFGRSLRGAFKDIRPIKPLSDDGKQYPSYLGIEIKA